MQDPTTTTTVNVPFPGGAEAHLRITVGACRLRVRPGDAEAWVTGTYHDPTRQVPLRVEADGAVVRLTQGVELRDPPAFLAGISTLDLALSNRQPYQLTLETGASENALDLGGLPITRLAIRFGAGKTEADFTLPSSQAMAGLEVAGGAGFLDLRHLANANATEIRVEGGAAGFRLDFGGVLQRDVEVRISTGLSSTELVIPATTAAKVTSESVLGGVEVGDGWMKTQGAFWNRAALDGATPTITVRGNVALGALQLH
jgi:hypothetical protein